jgi:hypothetical protein
MKYTYRITRKNEWKSIATTVFTFCFICLIVIVVSYFKLPDESIWSILPILLLLALLIFTPSYIIHLRYYFLNKDIALTYYMEERRFEIVNQKKGLTSSFRMDEIRYVMHTMSPARAERRSGGLPWEDYSYIEIFLERNEHFIITCLMIEKPDWQLGDKYQVVTTFYPYPSKQDSIH